MNIEAFGFALNICILESIEYKDILPLPSTILKCKLFLEQYRDQPNVELIPSLASDGSIYVTAFKEDGTRESEKIDR